MARVIEALQRIGNRHENDRTNIFSDERLSETAARNSKNYDAPAGYSYEEKKKKSSPAAVVGNISSNVGSAITDRNPDKWWDKEPKAEPKPDAFERKPEQPGLFSRFQTGLSNIKTSIFGKESPQPDRPFADRSSTQTNIPQSTTQQKQPATTQQSGTQSVGTGKYSAFGEIANIQSDPPKQDSATATAKDNSMLGTFFGVTSTFGSGKK